MAPVPGAALDPIRWLACSRLSTDRQGRSCLGLDVQWAKVAAMAAERGAVIAAELVEVGSGRRNVPPQLATALALARAEKPGMGGFVFCDLPDIDATTSAGRMVLTVMASVAVSEARRSSEPTREALAAAKVRGVKLGGYREVAALQSATRRERAITEAEPLLGPMVAAGMSYRAMAQALAGVAKVSSTGKPLAPAQVGRILQRLAVAGKPLGGDLRLVAS